MRALSLCLASVMTAGPIAAHAAPYDVNSRRAVAHAVTLDTLSPQTIKHLDWKKPYFDVWFDIPANDWVDDINLALKARPTGKVSSSEPLYVQLNDGDPVRISAYGRRFSAQIKLDPAQVSAGHNRVRFTYGEPGKMPCKASETGAWTIDMGATRLAIKSHTRDRPLPFRDIKVWLASPFTAPKTVSIRAQGANKIRHQVLAAQALALNVDHVPEFETQSRNADLEVVIAKRSALSHYVNPQGIGLLKNRTGALIAVTRAYPPQITITGDTDAEITHTIEALSTTPLPASRHAIITPGELYTSIRSTQNIALGTGVHKLSDIGKISFADHWAPAPVNLTFNVEDPTPKAGYINLTLNRGPDVSKNSVVNITLNDAPLGVVALSKSRQRVRLDIPSGLLHGVENRLTFETQLQPRADLSLCGASALSPGVSIDTRSSLHLENTFPSSNVDLARLTATGYPFIDPKPDKPSYVYVAQNNPHEVSAALKILAQISRQTYQGWKNTKILPLRDYAPNVGGNILIIGSTADITALNLPDAPRAFREAIAENTLARSQPVYTIPTRANERVLNSGRLVSGGIIALFRDADSAPQADSEGRIIGVITNARGKTLSSALSNLSDLRVWNAVEGSVARWDKTDVQLVQTAQRTNARQSSQTVSANSPWSLRVPEIPNLPNMGDINFGFHIKNWVSRLLPARQPNQNPRIPNADDARRTPPGPQAKQKKADQEKAKQEKAKQPKVQSPEKTVIPASITAPETVTPSTVPRFTLRRYVQGSQRVTTQGSPEIGPVGDIRNTKLNPTLRNEPNLTVPGNITSSARNVKKPDSSVPDFSVPDFSVPDLRSIKSHAPNFKSEGKRAGQRLYTQTSDMIQGALDRFPVGVTGQTTKLEPRYLVFSLLFCLILLGSMLLSRPTRNT